MILHEDPGVKLGFSFNGFNFGPLEPANGLLASFDDFTPLLCDGQYCPGADWSSPYRPGPLTYNSFTIKVMEDSPPGEVRFRKATFKYPTHRVGYAVKFCWMHWVTNRLISPG
jgi:hypothetical protein